MPVVNDLNNGNKGTFTSIGTITFYSSPNFPPVLPFIPSGNWSVYVVDSFESTPNRELLFWRMENYRAYGDYTRVSATSVYLTADGANGGAFNPFGTYCVIFYDKQADPEKLIYNNAVVFDGGNGEIYDYGGIY